MIDEEFRLWCKEGEHTTCSLTDFAFVEDNAIELVIKRGEGKCAVVASGLFEYRFRSLSKAQASSLILSSEDHPLLLDYGPKASLFGRAPLPDPYRFFLEFHRLVRDELNIEREPVEYLNYPRRMSEWLSIVYSRSYNLLTGPLAVAQGAAKLLDAQLSEYTLLPDSRPSISPSLLYLPGFWIIAERFTLRP